MNKLPVSVIVPHKKSRKPFFEGYCLPAIKANNPLEIIIIDEDGSAAVKRNKGAKQAKGEYLFFCDDDVILNSTCLETMLETLNLHPEASYAYATSLHIVIYKSDAYKNPVMLSNSMPWNPEILMKGNYIDTCSLIRKEAFLGFDEDLLKYEDWELWIRMLKGGRSGVYTEKLLYLSFKIDASVSLTVPDQPALRILKEKHPEMRILEDKEKEAM